MLANELMKKEWATVPPDNLVLNTQDGLYGLDPTQINPFAPPPPATTYQDLNKDVVVATNNGQTDGKVERS